ncbi:general substrate transporter [Cryphonectria parasitica EP155]|uniref:General substrate transporter n=1 Tax=Cryphonectria parasitica (strain ATCC 38755 / EP155) TaxID=660469 RepID=A0A9P4XUE9_CRYP1|nr:general substrate transporter [Cryphonectria parasitica EP155]KAF3760930.1 general substrate transporter [Cryphonectria parasitica EP155]
MDERQAMAVANAGGYEIDAFIGEMETELEASGGLKTGFFHLQFKDPRHFTWVIVAFASMGGLLSGLDQSLISGANLYLPGDLGLSTRQNSLVNSAMPLGAVGGALILGPCNESFGRRWAIIISTILYTIGAALEAGSINFGMIVAARVILGIGVGLEGGTVPVYVAETVERRMRGNLVSLYQFNIALGEVLGYAVAAMFLKVPGNWRYILGSSLVFSTIMFIGMLFLPESPRFLMHKGKTLEAYKVWKRIRGIEHADAKEEFFVMKASVQHEHTVVNESAVNKRFPWLDFFTVPRCRRALVYANIMILLGQLTGVNAIMYYMSTLMNQIGFNDEQANYMSLVGGGSLLIGTIPAIFLMEKFGRRFWANAMLPGFFVGLVIIGASYHIPLTTNLGGAEACYLIGLILYMGFFGCYACLTWVIPSEVYPTYLRSYGMVTSDALLFLASFIVTYNFAAMQNAMTRTGLALGFYGGIAVLGWFYQLLFMPETKDKTLEEIDLLFERPTREIVAENVQSVTRSTANFFTGRWTKSSQAKAAAATAADEKLGEKM